MAIWGHRKSEPSTEEVPGTGLPADAREAQPPSEPEHQAEGPVGEPEHQAEGPVGEPERRAESPAGEPEPAFWRAQDGAPPPVHGDAPAEATDSAEVQAPAMDESPAGTDAPAPVLTDDDVVLDEETAVKGPAPAESAPPPASPASAEGTTPQRWSEIMAAFVDDPHGSVQMAADAVDSAVEELVTSVRARQRALASSWQGSDADTEQLRTALREYRKFGAQVQQMSPPGPAGS